MAIPWESIRCWVHRWKDTAQFLSYLVGIFAAAWAAWTYRSNSRRERAKWAVQLYEKFYETERYKRMRQLFDQEVETDGIRDTVEAEGADFTDYLNFFELVAVLARNKQLSRKNVLDVFDYYLQCLRRHPSVKGYIDADKKNGFQHLKALI